jgi:hypothetical protein
LFDPGASARPAVWSATLLRAYYPIHDVLLTAFGLPRWADPFEMLV